MLFNTFQFLLFYLVVLAIYFATPHRWRWIVLLTASYYFYVCWRPAYVLIIWLITGIDFLVGIRLEECTVPTRRKAWFITSLVANLGILFVFKYADFTVATVQKMFHPFTQSADSPWLGWALPVGISFHTFQAISYTADVYHRRVRAERHLGFYALYVAFFPQMVAGPIERPGALLPQFHKRITLDYTRIRNGLQLILWGLFKKLIVADLIAPIVNRVYETPRQFGGSLLTLATVAFAIQIYADFSGYSDMAVGLARILGYDLVINFRQPMFANSIANYWRRWHVSLTSWFRDYVYLPAGGNRRHWAFNIGLVFALSGMWHGANWTFLLWGLCHAMFLILGRVLKPVRERLASWSGLERLPRLRTVLQVLLTNSLVIFAFIFFRAKSVADGFYIATHFLRLDPVKLSDLLSLGLPSFELFILALMAVALYAIEFLQLYPNARITSWWEKRRSFRWAVYCTAFYSLVFVGVFDRVEFIYFQF